MKKQLSIILSIVFFSILFCGCKEDKRNVAVIGYTHPDFETKYTEEEHIQRILDLTNKKFADAIDTRKIVSYDVEIVYAFYDNDPEYFLVNLEYAEEWSGFYNDYGYELEYTTKYKHIIGFILRDEYYISLPSYHTEFKDGRNCYEVCGYKDAKKYFGFGRHGVKTDEGILQIFDASNCVGSAEFYLPKYYYERAFKQFLVTEEQQEKYMKTNYKQGHKKYFSAES